MSQLSAVCCTELHFPIYKSDISSYETLTGVDLSITASGTYEGSFTATSNSMFLLFEMIPGVNPPPDCTGYYWIDDVSVEEIKAGHTTHVGKEGYRYGFNGKELDKETSSTTTYDYGFRIYNPALGRFLSVDPLINKYPELTPYQFASNSPIAGVDLEGLEFYFAADGTYLGQSKNGGTQLRVATEYHSNPNRKSQVIFTKYKDIENVSPSIASKVYATIYKREVRNPHASGVSASDNTSGGAFAATNPETKHITVYYKKSMQSDDGNRPKLMTDYYDAASTLNHEDDHASGLTDNGFDHFKIGVREANNRFKSNVSKYYRENLIYNMKDYLRDQVNAILTFKNNGDQESESFYRKEYEKNVQTFNKLFGKNIKSFFEISDKNLEQKKSPPNKP